MILEICSKCRKKLDFGLKRYQCAACGAWFCPSCMDRHCFFCKGEVKDVPAQR
ncbi:MAG: hypothetical protein WC881_09245 [Elusimicrobiota bacterium]